MTAVCWEFTVIEHEQVRFVSFLLKVWDCTTIILYNPHHHDKRTNRFIYWLAKSRYRRVLLSPTCTKMLVFLKFGSSSGRFRTTSFHIVSLTVKSSHKNNTVSRHQPDTSLYKPKRQLLFFIKILLHLLFLLSDDCAAPGVNYRCKTIHNMYHELYNCIHCHMITRFKRIKLSISSVQYFHHYK